MSRATNAPASRQRRRRVLRAARGFRGGRHRLFRTATESVDRAMKMATEHRKLKKRDYRSLWVIRLGSACRKHEISYSRFMAGVAKAGIRLNRKMLSEIALHDPEGFGAIVQIVRAALA